MRIKNKRKAQQGMGIGIMGMFVLVGLTVWFVSNWFTGTTAEASTSFGKLNLINKHDLCKIAGEKIKERGEEPKEAIEGDKKDGFPDDCDICLGGDDNKITNSYGIPDACYADPNKKHNEKEVKTYKDMCKIRRGCYISDTTQCCLLGKGKCGVKCT